MSDLGRPPVASTTLSVFSTVSAALLSRASTVWASSSVPDAFRYVTRL